MQRTLHVSVSAGNVGTRLQPLNIGTARPASPFAGIHCAVAALRSELFYLRKVRVAHRVRQVPSSVAIVGPDYVATLDDPVSRPTPGQANPGRSFEPSLQHG